MININQLVADLQETKRKIEEDPEEAIELLENIIAEISFLENKDVR